MFENFGFEICTLLKDAENERNILRHPYVGSEHLLLAILKKNNKLSSFLKNYDLTYNRFRKELIDVVGTASKESSVILYTPLLKRVLENALDDAKELNNGTVTEEHLVLSLLEEGEGIAIRLLLSMDIDLDEIYNKLKRSNMISLEQDLEILKIGIDLNKEVDLLNKVVGRNQEIDFMIETLLRKKKNNPILIGPAGVGKTAIVEELARRINEGSVPEELKSKRIITLEMGSLVSGTKYRGEFEERLTKIINELKENQNIIVFIDEIHTMVNAGGAEGAINASDILKPYLARGVLKCIGATTTNEYYQYIAKDKALERRFEVIQIKEPNEEETVHILKTVRAEYENHHQIFISDENIKSIVKNANLYLFNKFNPDKSLELLDSVCARVKTKNNRAPMSKEEKMNELKAKKEEYVKKGDYQEAIKLKTLEKKLLEELEMNLNTTNQIEENDILEVLEQKSLVPILFNKKKLMTKLTKVLTENIFGQKKALDKIIYALKYKKSKSKPLSCLLVGPTGVGKTESVKLIQKVICPETEMIRLDMSEYNQEISINKLLGAPSGYVGYDDSYIFRQLMDHPHAVILVDEIEKAHPRVLNLFLQILDEGKITNSKGETIHFDYSYIFMTSNIKTGAKVGFSNIKLDEIENVLSKELVGRMDEIIEYENINEDAVNQFIDKHLLDSENKDSILKECEYQKFGLRNVSLLVKKYNKMLQEN